MSDEDLGGSPRAIAMYDRVGNAADATQVAESIAAALMQINAVLTPIIGQRGAAAVFMRCLHLSVATHPWLLPASQEGIQPALDPSALKSILAQQRRADAVDAGRAVLQTFHDILVSLIGTSLTDRLLRTVWENSLGGPPAQDISP